MQQAKYLAVNVFNEGITPEEQQKVQPVNPSDTTNSSPSSSEQKTTQQAQSNTTDSSVQQNDMPAYIPWAGAGLAIIIVILVALLTILRKLNQKKSR